MEIIFSTGLGGGVGVGEALVYAARHPFYSVSHLSRNKTVYSHSSQTSYLAELYGHLSRLVGHIVRSGWNRNTYEVSLRKDTTRKYIIVYSM